MGHVAEDQDDAGNASAIVNDRCGGIVDGDHSAAPCNQGGVVGEPDHRTRPEDVRRGIFDRRPGFLVDDPEHVRKRLTEGFRQRPAHESFGSRVQVGDPGAGVCGDDRVADARQGDRVAPLAGGAAASGPVQDFRQRANHHAGQHEQSQGVAFTPTVHVKREQWFSE